MAKPEPPPCNGTACGNCAPAFTSWQNSWRTMPIANSGSSQRAASSLAK